MLLAIIENELWKGSEIEYFQLLVCLDSRLPESDGGLFQIS